MPLTEHHQITPRTRVPTACLGLHRLSLGLVAVQSAMIVFIITAFSASGMHFSWDTWAVDLAVPLAALAPWLYFLIWPGRQAGDWVIAEMFLVVALFFALAVLVPPGQYAALALKRPLADAWLNGFDRMLGIDVPGLTGWTHSQPRWFKLLLLYAYLSLLWQFFVLPLVLGAWHRNRTALWEYAFHFHVCSFITMIALALWPAAGVYTFNQFTPVFDLEHTIRQFGGVHAGTITTIRPADMDGLVSMPSFHFAGALMVTWALRQYRWWMVLLIPLNALLTLATVLSGAHYVADLFGTLAMCGVSLWFWRRFAHRWIEQAPGQGTPRVLSP